MKAKRKKNIEAASRQEALAAAKSLRRGFQVAVADCGVNDKGEWVEIAISNGHATWSVKLGGDLLGAGKLDQFSVLSEQRRDEPISDSLLEKAGIALQRFTA